jgi:hypothetical protein
VLTFVVVCLLLVGPFALPVTQLWKEGARPQSLKYLDSFSASPLDFVYPNVLQPLWGAWLLQHYQQPIENILYLGLTPLILAALALWRRRTPRTSRPERETEYQPRQGRRIEPRVCSVGTGDHSALAECTCVYFRARLAGADIHGGYGASDDAPGIVSNIVL